MEIPQDVRDAASRVIASDRDGTPTSADDLALLDQQSDDTLAELGLLF